MATPSFSFEPDATEYSPINAYALAQCSNLAYSPKEKAEAQVIKWGFAKSNFKFFKEADTEGFAVSNDQALIVAFRGTASVSDALTDSNTQMTNGPFGGMIHQGFGIAINAVTESLNRKLRRMDKPSRKVWVTGHSLGGALATLYAARRLDVNDPVAGMYTYGSPRVGDETFREGFNAKMSNYYRMVFGRDIVSRVAPRTLHYSHVGQLTTISRDGKISVKGYEEASFLSKVAHTMDALRKKDFKAVSDHKLSSGYLPMLKKRASQS